MGSLLLFLLVALCIWMMLDMYGGHAAAGSTLGAGTDPVCGMTVEAGQGYARMYSGRLYRFCSRRCLERFDDDPQRYLGGPQGDSQPGGAS